MSSSLLAELRERAAQSGLNLLGLVDAERFDRGHAKEQRVTSIVPTCGTVLVLGSAGHDLHTSVVEGDARVLAGARALASMAACFGPCRLVLAGERSTLSFPRLAEAAGFGTVSPVSGLLLHPKFGPWIRLRAALLIAGRPFGPIVEASIVDQFNPCCTCARPCAGACPAGAHDGLGNHRATHVGRSVQSRSVGEQCSSRAVCPIGHEHRQELPPARHGSAATRGRLWAVFRLVPRFWRGHH